MTDRAPVWVHASKLLRLRDLVSALHDELPAAPTDRFVLADDTLRAALVEIETCVSDALLAELESLVAPLGHPDRTVDELRVATAQLLGWIDALLADLHPVPPAPSEGAA
jgi:hypothetical protein